MNKQKPNNQTNKQELMCRHPALLPVKVCESKCSEDTKTSLLNQSENIVSSNF